MNSHKFQIGDLIIRGRRKNPRKVLGYGECEGYILSDEHNKFGQVWWNKYQVEKLFKRVSNENIKR